MNITDHGDYFTDNATALDWLDITKTLGRSYLDISSQLGTGGEFDGWRYARAAEFGQMWSNVSGDAITIHGTGEVIRKEYGVELQELIQVLGNPSEQAFIRRGYSSGCDFLQKNSAWSCPHGSSDFVSARGLLFDDYTADAQYQYVAHIVNRDIVNPRSDMAIPDKVATTFFTPDTQSYVWLGSWLIRDSFSVTHHSMAFTQRATAVPEPAPIALLAVGVICFRMARKT